MVHTDTYSVTCLCVNNPRGVSAREQTVIKLTSSISILISPLAIKAFRNHRIRNAVPVSGRPVYSPFSTFVPAANPMQSNNLFVISMLPFSHDGIPVTNHDTLIQVRNK
jgi:hypothetical protein